MKCLKCPGTREREREREIVVTFDLVNNFVTRKSSFPATIVIIVHRELLYIFVKYCTKQFDPDERKKEREKKKKKKKEKGRKKNIQQTSI